MATNGTHSQASSWREHLVLLGWDSPAAGPGTALRTARGRPVTGTRLEWTGPGDARVWELDGPIEARRTYGGEVWARLDGAPVISRLRAAGRSFLQVGLRGAAPQTAAALRRMLIGARGPCAWLDLSGIVVLRMDDPGACTSIHLDGWRFDGLDEAGFAAIGGVARRHDARITIGFTPAWIDDGDPDRGELLIGGRPAERVPGALHPSALVDYRASDGLMANCAAEYRGIEELRRLGVGSIELHGYTHLHPDRELWAAAESRGRKQGWFREFAPENAPGNGAVEDRIERGLEMFADRFEHRPSALVCPGHGWTDAVLANAHRAGLDMVCAEWLGVRNGAGYTRISGVAVRALDWGETHLLRMDAPVIAWFHDRDIALHGAEWLDGALASWRRGGATRFADLDELGCALGLRPHLERRDGTWLLRVERVDGRPLPRPFPVAVSLDGETPETIALEAGGEVGEAAVERREGAPARVMLPAGV